MTQTHATSKADNNVLAKQVYDNLMSEIETDLLLKNIPLLDAKYANETKAEHEARMQRYAKAYKKFDVAFDNFMAKIKGKVRSSHRKALHEREEQDKTAEQDTLISIASAFN